MAAGSVPFLSAMTREECCSARTVTGRSKAEVLAKFRDVTRQLEDGMPAPDDRMTVG
jgi:hypothetical protein